MRRLIGLVLAAFFLIASVWQYRRQQEFLAHALVADGTVVEVFGESRSGSHEDTGSGYVRFQERSGKTRYSLFHGRLLHQFEVGEKVQVFYEPGVPRPIEIDLKAESWIPWALAAFGVMLLFVSVIPRERKL